MPLSLLVKLLTLTLQSYIKNPAKAAKEVKVLTEVRDQIDAVLASILKP